MNNLPFRALAPAEQALIERLLQIEFPGRDQIREQLRHAEVRLVEGCEDHCGSLDFRIDSPIPIPNSRAFNTKVPVEGLLIDLDGMPVEVLLFHRNGRLTKLEFVVFSDRLKHRPTASEITVRWLSRDPPPAGWPVSLI